MSRYLLSKSAFLCVRDHQLILLDLRSGKYAALDIAQMRPLGALVQDWPVGESSKSDRPASADNGAVQTAQALLHRGLLTTDPTLGKSAAPVVVAPPSAALGYKPSYARAAIHIRDVWAFCTASLFASAALRWGTIDDVVRYIRRRKMARAQDAEPVDMERVGELVAIFSRLRPFAFDAKDACLFHSLALMRFLFHYEVFPQCVFGVQTTPFAAHCWIQQGDTVLNDTVERVRRYTPIMAI